MAVLRNVLLAASLLTPLALAIPMMDKRAIYTHTQTEIAWITVEETTTVWVDPAQATPPPPATTASTTTVPGALFAATTLPSTTFATAVASVAPPPSSVTEAVAPAAPAPSQPPPAVPSAPAPVVTTSAPVEPSSVPVQPKDISASSSANCEGSGAACVGDVTHWDGGLGACGWNVDTSSQMAIALPFGFMGTQSNGNPYCGRSVTLVNPTSGTTVQATVGDKCMGCTDRAIDCTDALFAAITDGKGDGRLSGIQWYFS